MSVIRSTTCFKPNHLNNSSILTLCKFGKLKEAINTLLCTTVDDLPPSTYSSLLQLCIDFKAKREGRSLHEHLSATGVVQDVHLSTKFVIFYSKIGDCRSAREVFDEMPERNIVTWTAMISCYLQNGYPAEALEVFSLIHRSGFRPNQFTYASALTACCSVGCLRNGEQIHSCIVKSRFAGNKFVQSALMDMHLRCGSVENALFLFNEMPIRDVVSWNSIIRGVSDHRLYGNTFSLFGLMMKDGMVPDHITFASILKSCASIKIPSNVDIIHSLVVKLGLQCDQVATGSLIDAYAKSGSMLEAKALFRTMVQPDLVSGTALMTALSNEKEGCKESLGIFSNINRLGLKLDGVILCSMLNICANLAFLVMGRQIHASVIKFNILSDVALWNALIDMYAKSGDLKDARHVFDEMPSSSRNVVSWTALMSGYGKSSCNDSALTLFEDMEKDGVKPNDVTFLAIMTACAYAGRTKEGMLFFNSMVNQYKIKPRDEHYCSAVDLLARGGNLNEAFEFVQKMNFKPNTSIWGALMGACGAHGDLVMGEIAARNISSLDPVKSVNYITLSNIYASRGLWEEVIKIRRLMSRKRCRRDFGLSLLPD